MNDYIRLASPLIWAFKCCVHIAMTWLKER
jgi:hypothetical protein